MFCKQILMKKPKKTKIKKNTSGGNTWGNKPFRKPSWFCAGPRQRPHCRPAKSPNISANEYFLDEKFLQKPKSQLIKTLMHFFWKSNKISSL